MVDENIEIIKLETHDTHDISDQHTNGVLTVIWRDWDKKIKNEPKMIYVNSIYPGERKGPHIHTKRSSYFTCIHGEVIFIIKNKDNSYLEIKSNSTEPTLIHVPKNFPSAHINVTNETAKVLVLADIAWRPNDDEMKNTDFENYDWNKWNA